MFAMWTRPRPITISSEAEAAFELGSPLCPCLPACHSAVLLAACASSAISAEACTSSQVEGETIGERRARYCSACCPLIVPELLNLGSFSQIPYHQQEPLNSYTYSRMRRPLCEALACLSSIR
ncbi:hypothetical protein BV20DRAFT_1102069 [Pilatotrama ljubarskyi]|nr:hypothetical protein BV20DRAFT_1102069 [Pilatotrama ljubarskyi]